MSDTCQSQLTDPIPDDPQGSPMEVILNAKNNSLTFGDSLLHICPLPGKLHGSLDGFGSGVHWEHHVVAEHLRDLLGEAPKDAVVEGPRREGEFLGLLNEGGDDLRVAMPLLHDVNYRRIVQKTRYTHLVYCADCMEAK